LQFFKYRPNVNVDFAFISVRYTYTNLETRETLYHITRGAK